MSSCSLSNFADVVQAVREHRLNATDYVISCDDACIVTFGAGNPDISGRGVMVAYIFQVSMTCIFGPLLPIFIWLMRSRTSRRRILLEESFFALKKRIYRVNALYSISLLVAAIVRSKQAPPILEISFITRLIGQQIYIFIAMTFSQLYDSNLNGTKISILWILCHVCICIAQAIVSLTVKMPRSAISVCYDIALACHTKRHTIDISSMFKDGDISKFKLKWLVIAMGIGLGIGLLIGFLTTCVNPIRNFLEKLGRRFPLWMQKNGWSMFWISILLVWVACLILGSVALFISRNDMKQLSSGQFNDNEWGYGQTTAVLLWTPFNSIINVRLL
ncbi:hypothetical protein K505DRAFT_360959 [Melanomma pulvis-pyrius CBS 109.77]|uniref:Uncharacterized protein n=1 Tax=Melanomma pulvis-pyrius CBS 109.77 TaxID=1314802 RepID=A0A6A6XDL0_9PLEO|nr:hypothetical protein K505DRAFT_360959 [Melanomma pulvis-pyrius CBS 109.77]